ncbi:General transcription factor IIE subunit 2 [Frankliniella fusca]|uniref:General transcription factor IIE subunit 2 n=1 Tax=Frankliniella fusca TaxID=407009 RepID=A0AAE1LX84_9NEOP|nr:General transcription factor IIE subunit 2 [Frankliniella fusca]
MPKPIPKVSYCSEFFLGSCIVTCSRPVYLFRCALGHAQHVSGPAPPPTPCVVPRWPGPSPTTPRPAEPRAHEPTLYWAHKTRLGTERNKTVSSKKRLEEVRCLVMLEDEHDGLGRGGALLDNADEYTPNDANGDSL